MKRMFILGLFLIQSLAFADQLPIGTEVEILKNINFPERMIGVWLQDGSVVEQNLDSDKAHCLLSNADSRNYDYETGINKPVTKGESYQVENFINNSWVLVNKASKRTLFLDCDKSENLYNLFVDKITGGRLPYIGDTNHPRLKTIKKITNGLLLIKN